MVSSCWGRRRRHRGGLANLWLTPPGTAIDTVEAEACTTVPPVGSQPARPGRHRHVPLLIRSRPRLPCRADGIVLVRVAGRPGGPGTTRGNGRPGRSRRWREDRGRRPAPRLSRRSGTCGSRPQSPRSAWPPGSLSGPSTTSATTRITSSFAGLRKGTSVKCTAHPPRRPSQPSAAPACPRGWFGPLPGQRPPMRERGQIRMNALPTIRDFGDGAEPPGVLRIGAVVPHHEVLTSWDLVRLVQVERHRVRTGQRFHPGLEPRLGEQLAVDVDLAVRPRRWSRPGGR